MPIYSSEGWYEAERLHRAASDGDLAEIEHLISSGYDVNLFDGIGRTPLHYAAVSGQRDAVRLLLRYNALVDANDEATISDTPLAVAVESENLDVVLLLLESGADPDIKGWMGLTARDRACRRGDSIGSEICRFLLEHRPRSA